MRAAVLILTVGLMLGCVPGGGGGGGSGGSGGSGGEGGMGGGGDADGGVTGPSAPARLTDEDVATLAYGSTIGALAVLAAQPGFDAAAMGDPGPFIAEGPTSPEQPTVFASVYYQSTDFAETLEGARDRRPGVEADDEAGNRVASRIARSIQLGAVSEGDTNARGGARWHALQAARRADALTLFTAWRHLDERSAVGFDRFLGLLWTAGGAPHGTGARIAAADALCGTGHLEAIAQALGDARGPFAAAIESVGQLDPLDRLVIEEGDSPEYDAAIATTIEALADGLAVAMLASLDAGVDSATQAELLGALDVVAPDLRSTDQGALDMLGVMLDDADPANIDPDTVRDLVSGALGVSRCAP